MMESHMALIMAATGVGKTHITLNSLEKEYFHYHPQTHPKIQ